MVAPTVLPMSTTTPSKKSLKAARRAVRASRMRRAAAGVWPRLCALVMGAPAGAVFTVSVPQARREPLVKAAGELGYDANEVCTSGRQVTMNLVWTGTGYPPLSAVQGRDLVAGLGRYSLQTTAVGGPRAGVSPLREWRVVAEHEEDALSLAKWFEGQGYAVGTVRATTEQAARRMAELLWCPPVPWVLMCNQDDAQAPDAGLLSWIRRRLRETALVVGIILGGLVSWRMGWSAPISGNDAPSANLGSWNIYTNQVLPYLVAELVVIVLFILMQRAPIRAVKDVVPTEVGDQDSQLPLWKRVSSLLAVTVLGAWFGWLWFTTLRDEILSVVVVATVIAVIGVVGRLLDPPDRRRMRLPVALLGALVGFISWAALADYFLAAGLGVPFGVAKADLFTRAMVLGIIVLPPVMVLVIGGWVFRLGRRQERFMASVLAAMTLFASLVITLAGSSLVMAEADRMVKHPGQGLWSLSVSLQRVHGIASPGDGNSKSSYTAPGELYNVVGEVGDHAVLLTHPCGDGEQQVVVRSAGSLSFEPADLQACNQERVTVAAGRSSP